MACLVVRTENKVRWKNNDKKAKRPLICQTVVIAHYFFGALSHFANRAHTPNVGQVNLHEKFDRQSYCSSY